MRASRVPSSWRVVSYHQLNISFVLVTGVRRLSPTLVRYLPFPVGECEVYMPISRSPTVFRTVETHDPRRCSVVFQTTVGDCDLHICRSPSQTVSHRFPNGSRRPCSAHEQITISDRASSTDRSHSPTVIRIMPNHGRRL